MLRFCGHEGNRLHCDDRVESVLVELSSATSEISNVEVVREGGVSAQAKGWACCCRNGIQVSKKRAFGRGHNGKQVWHFLKSQGASSIAVSYGREDFVVAREDFIVGAR